MFVIFSRNHQATLSHPVHCGLRDARMNRLHFTFFQSLGNHEFDLKVEGLIPYLNFTEFPILAANVHDDRLVRLEKSTILDVRGYKIGIIGYLTPQTVDISGAPDVNMTDEVPAINEECLKMKANNIKTVIAVGHSGYEMDQQIGRECECVDMVVGGHTNTFLWNGPAPSYEKPEGPYPTVVRSHWGKKVPVVQAYAYTKYLGKLEVTIDTDSGRITSWDGEPIFVNHAIPQDEETLEFLKPWKVKVDEMDVRVVGRSKVYLDGVDTSCRRKECNFGNLITDAFVDYRARLYRGHFWTDIPIAIINGGAIRMSIDGRSRDGNITLADLTGALPFNNDLYAVTLTGKELLQVLEFSVHSDGNTSLGEFLQVSGLEVVYDRSNPSGRRVVSVKARCGMCSIPKYEPVETLKEYRILLPNFIGNGGDGYKVLRAAKKTVIGINEADGLISFLKAHRIIYPAVEERISFVTPQMKLGPGRSRGFSRQSNAITVSLIGVTYLVRIFVT